MKPRNNFERELQGYIDRGLVSPVTPKQAEQALKAMDKEKKQRMFLFNTEQTINGMHLTKCYKAHRMGKGSLMTMFCLCLIHAERGDESAWAARSTGMGVVDSFSHTGEVSIKNCTWWYEDYIKGNRLLHSTGTADPYAVTRQLNHNTYYFKDSRMETLAKSHDAHDNELIGHVIECEKPLNQNIWMAYKVARRHGYDFQGELWRWVSYVNYLYANGMDIHNPHYVCPANLVEAHHRMIDERDRRLRMRMEMQRRINEAKRLEEAMRYEAEYIEQHKRWLALVIVGDGITITPLQSVSEFKAEGDAMHHCVYSNGYYKKADTLIMSARDESGNRLATIEYNLKTGRVIQCRAACNAEPKRYNDIVSLVKRSNELKTIKYAA